MNNKEILKKLESDYLDIVETVFHEAGNGWWIHINVDKIKYHTYDEGCYTIHEDTLREAYAVLKRVIKRVEAKEEKMKKELKKELKEELSRLEVWDASTNSWQEYDFPQGETVESYASWCVGGSSDYWATINNTTDKIRLNGWRVIDGKDYYGKAAEGMGWVAELTPVYDAAKSFYNKAKVIKKDGNLNLYSYNMLVAYIDNNETFKILGFHSATTLRHIKEFYKQFYKQADEKITKNDLEKYLIKR